MQLATNFITLDFFTYMKFRFLEALFVAGLWLAIFIGIGLVIVIIAAIQTYIFPKRGKQ